MATGRKFEGVSAYSSRDACEQALRVLFQDPDGAGAAIKVYLRSFASFNQTFGYKQGELMLREIAGWLAGLPGAEVFRFGSGVGFVLLLEGADPASATATAQSIADRFEQPWPIGQIDCVCAVDIGVVLYPEYAKSPDALLHNLDLALDQSAKAGRGQITVFGAALQERLYRNSIIAKLLVGAVASGNIELRYRPVFCAANNTYTRIECQARLLTVEFGPVKAAEFMPIAEESGIVCFVNNYVIGRACALIRELLDEGVPFESLSVQVSPVMLLQHRFVPDITEMIAQHNIPAGKLAFELQESPIAAPVARKVKERLKELGVEVVLGSFDFGPSGFNDLLTQPIDAIKLGRHFVWQLETNRRSGPVIEALIQAAERLGVKIIAEGVETEQQDMLLSRYQCPYRQGFYYSPLLGQSDLKALLKE